MIFPLLLNFILSQVKIEEGSQLLILSENHVEIKFVVYIGK